MEMEPVPQGWPHGKGGDCPTVKKYGPTEGDKRDLSHSRPTNPPKSNLQASHPSIGGSELRVRT